MTNGIVALSPRQPIGTDRAANVQRFRGWSSNGKCGFKGGAAIRLEHF